LLVSAIDSVNCYLGSDGSISTSISGGSNGYTFLWNDALKQKTSNASNLKAGKYTLVASDIYGCKDSVSGIVKEPAKVIISISDFKDATCFGYSDAYIQTATQGGTPGYQYLWNTIPNQTTSKASNLKIGTYKVVVTDYYGCTDSLEKAISEPVEIIVKLPTPMRTMKGLTYEFEANVTPNGNYNWSWSPTTLFDFQSPFPTPRLQLNESRIIKVQATNSKGCFGRDSAEIEVLQPLSQILPTGFSPNGDGLNDRFKPFDFFEILDLRVYNRWGQCIYISNGSQEGWDGTYQGEDVPSGVYTYQIQVQLTGTNQAVRNAGSLTLLR
jgi:gliding motility-associated-like protein